MDPYNPADAKRRAQMEPLVEIYQDKGSSECRYDPRYLAGTDITNSRRRCSSSRRSPRTARR